MNNTYKYMTSISRNVCMDKLDDLVIKYNKTYRSAITMKPVMQIQTYILTLTQRTTKKILNLKLTIMIKI